MAKATLNTTARHEQSPIVIEDALKKKTDAVLDKKEIPEFTCDDCEWPVSAHEEIVDKNGHIRRRHFEHYRGGPECSKRKKKKS